MNSMASRVRSIRQLFLSYPTHRGEVVTIGRKLPNLPNAPIRRSRFTMMMPAHAPPLPAAEFIAAYAAGMIRIAEVVTAAL